MNFRLYTADGKLVRRFQVHSFESLLEFGNLSPDIYFWNITGEKITPQSGKFYKNNLRWVRLQVGPRADFNGDQITNDIAMALRTFRSDGNGCA